MYVGGNWANCYYGLSWAIIMGFRFLGQNDFFSEFIFSHSMYDISRVFFCLFLFCLFCFCFFFAYLERYFLTDLKQYSKIISYIYVCTYYKHFDYDTSYTI